MEELWQESNVLIAEEKWIKAITNLRSNIALSNKEEAKKQLKEAFISAVKNRLPRSKFGVLFSGGIDSTFIAIICSLLGKDFVCYTVGFQDGTKKPEDLIEAENAAKEFGFTLKTKLFNLTEAEAIVKETVAALKLGRKRVDVVNVGVGAVVLSALALGKQEKIGLFFSGLGSEEIFAGYDRHSKVSDVNEECWNGLKAMWKRDLERDTCLSWKIGAKIVTPFLDKDLIKLAMQMPAEWKIAQTQKKIILREVAAEFLGKFAWRMKKAAQYGSCFDKAIEKLAHKKGFKFKKDYLESL